MIITGNIMLQIKTFHDKVQKYKTILLYFREVIFISDFLQNNFLLWNPSRD